MTAKAEGRSCVDTFSEDFIFEGLNGEAVNVLTGRMAGHRVLLRLALGRSAATQHLIAPPLVLHR